MLRLGSRRYRRHRGTGVSPWVIILICVTAAILVTVIIGNLLKIWLDEGAYDRLTSGEATTPSEQEVQKPIAVRDVHADAYVFGKTPAGVWESLAEVSISINTPAGEVNYTSDVAAYLGFVSGSKAVLFDEMGDLRAVSEYISGIFYPQAFAQESLDLQYAQTARECALMREFLRAGGSEILLRELPLVGTDTATLIRYVQQVKQMAGDAPVGVAIPLEIAQREGAWEMLARLAQGCDFLALDLSDVDPAADVSTLLTDARYFIQQYDMRVLVDERQEDLILAVYAYSDVQIATHYEKVTPPSEEENA